MRNRIVSLLLSAILIAVCLGDASDAAPRSKRNRDATASNRDEQVVVVATGTIRPGSYQKFLRDVSRWRPTYVVLDGPGGVLGEALRIGQEVRRRGLSTVVLPNARCAAGCAVVFLSGRARYMGKGAAIGLNAAASLDGRPSQEGTLVLAYYLRSVGVPARIVRKMSTTAPSDIHWLSRSERRAVGIKQLEALPHWREGVSRQ